MNDIREVYAYCGGKEVFKDKRVVIKGRASMTLLPDFFLVTVYNMEAEDLARIETYKEIKFLDMNKAVICSGKVEDVYRKYESTNELFEISIADGQEFWESTVNKAIGGGASFSTTLRTILIGAKMGGFLAEDKRLVRGQTFTGRLADAVLSIARGASARAFISDDVLHVVTKGKSEIIVKIQEDDLLEDPDNASGVLIVRTDVKSWPVGMLHEFRNNRYRLVSKAISADNYEGDWRVELLLVNESDLDDDGMEGG